MTGATLALPKKTYYFLKIRSRNQIYCNMTNTNVAIFLTAAAALFEEHFSEPPVSIVPLPSSGSDRKYYRVSGASHTAMATIGTNIAENNTFFYVTELFRKHGIKVPQVYHVSKDRKVYLQQDLGNTSLFDLLTRDGNTEAILNYFKQAAGQLAKIHWAVSRDTDFRQCCGASQFDENAILADLLYFKYYFADLQELNYDKAALMRELESFSRDLGHLQPLTFMYRDFQSRNIMICDGELYFIDYQGFMKGPAQYDLASLLWQARAALPEKWKEDILNSYLRSLEGLDVARLDEVFFRRGYVQVVLIRLLQVLGAYGFRGLFQRKAHFLSSIVPALNNIAFFLEAHPQSPAYPELRKLLEALSYPEIRQKYTPKMLGERATLVVDICSFSYKKGIPDGGSAHGGGFVFDCRGILNPGRFDQYKILTGNDDAVKQFLENETRMPEFLEHATAAVAISVEDYIARGFEHLTVAFGCTGGQHRSVYAANHLAALLTKRYGVAVKVSHLNQSNWVRE
jgi:aminoglycoside/choline kinase family phosphotransferase